MNYLPNQPESIQVHTEGMYQAMSFTNRRFGAVIFPAMLMFIFTMVLLDTVDRDLALLRVALRNPTALQIAMGGGIFVIALSVLLPALRGLINRTTIKVGAGKLIVEEGPLPPFRSFEITASDIRNIRVDRQRSTKGRGYALLTDSYTGDQQRIVAGIPDRLAATFLQQQIESRLMLASEAQLKRSLNRPSQPRFRNLQHTHGQGEPDPVSHSHQKDWPASAGRNLRHDHSQEQSEAAQKIGQLKGLVGGRSKTLALPKNITMGRDGVATLIMRHWSGAPVEIAEKQMQTWLAVAGGLLLVLFLIIGFPLLVIAVIFGANIYRFVADKINRTEIRIDNNWIKTKHVPMPWPSAEDVPLRDIKSLSVERVTKQRKNKKPRVTWSLFARINQTKREVLKGLPDEEDAELLKNLLAKELGLQEDTNRIPAKAV